MKHLGAETYRLAQAAGAHRQDHEFLQVNAVVGMRATINDVHHRHRHLQGTVAAEQLIQANRLLARHRMRGGQGCGQNGIGAQTALVVRTVKIDQ
jgi:hypothetical protein